jgi:vacuolar-type H+-ATPase subunit I/STV1
MSIENEIKKLRESVEGLTSSILGVLEPIEGLEYSIDELKHTVFQVENRISEVQKISTGYKPAEKIAPVEEQSKTIKKVEIKNPPKPLEDEVDNEKNQAKVKVTNDMVKQLGKEKMGEGVDRSKIKSIITSLAGPDASIADLDESNIEECYNKISELQPK